jgi:hypothetical protein
MKDKISTAKHNCACMEPACKGFNSRLVEVLGTWCHSGHWTYLDLRCVRCGDEFCELLEEIACPSPFARELIRATRR